ncbi:flagellar basal body P-ring formation chaperone FlgA [Kiloniella sp. b19]|uniref:flagellar basal body P-ring formation chaperone FlgA n=1 Tax=Kiloniella sp. GXU_MW_B19 TaxID=3141326 RepID=UPI0031D8C55A
MKTRTAKIRKRFEQASKAALAATLALAAVNLQGTGEAQATSFAELRKQNSPETAAESQIAALPVELRQDIAVEGDIVRLGDIFAGLHEEAEMPIARAPKLGQDVVLPAHWLSALAKKYNVNWEPHSHLVTTTLRRDSYLLSSDIVLQEIQDFMTTQSSSVDIGVTLDRKTKNILIPTEYSSDLELNLVRYNPQNGRFVVTASVMKPDGQPYTTRTLSGKVEEMVSVPVPVRPLRSGDIITAGDLEWHLVSLNKVDRTSIQNMDDLIGKYARRTLRTETPIKATDVDSVKAVLKNKTITMQVISGALTLTATGRALEDGAIGDTIRIMNNQTNQVVLGTINASGSAEVTIATAQLGG